MNKMTWLDLYNFLHSKAHDFRHLGDFNWDSPVIVHDAETGDEYNCDTWSITTDHKQDKLVLAINIGSIFAENKKGKS